MYAFRGITQYKIGAGGTVQRGQEGISKEGGHAFKGAADACPQAGRQGSGSRGPCGRHGATRLTPTDRSSTLFRNNRRIHNQSRCCSRAVMSQLTTLFVESSSSNRVGHLGAHACLGGRERPAGRGDGRGDLWLAQVGAKATVGVVVLHQTVA
jgi:hypothetical protein